MWKIKGTKTTNQIQSKIGDSKKEIKSNRTYCQHASSMTNFNTVVCSSADKFLKVQCAGGLIICMRRVVYKYIML